MAGKQWKRGRGKLGFLEPLLGGWRAHDPETPMGPVVCERHFEKVLEGKFFRLVADWDIGGGRKSYREIALYGADREKVPAFWSFTSDGGTAQGTLADVSDLHPEARGFEAQMPAGLARQAFWPIDDGMLWVVEARVKSGWSRMIEHTCRRI